MTDNPNRTTIDDEAEDVLQRLLDGTQNLQRRIFRLMSRKFMTPAAVGQLGYDAMSISREIADLEKLLKDDAP